MLIAKFYNIKKVLDFKEMLSDELADECLLANSTMLVNGDVNALQLEIMDQLKRYRTAHKAVSGLRNPTAVEFILFDLGSKGFMLEHCSGSMLVGIDSQTVDLSEDHG